ncbi:MAG: hypothetical protein KA508_06795 [Gammaproteobacteria bacterium]|nr:hypothetical protein [Gammaproteobacteria bacterium]
MKDTIFNRGNQLQKVHTLLSSELSEAWPLIERGLPMDIANLVLLSNILHTLYLLTVPGIPEKLYKNSCKSLFAMLAEIQWALPMIAKIEEAFGKECYFLRVVLEKD